MSHAALRNRIRTELANYAATQSFDFFDTINSENRITSSEWATVEFYPDYIEKLCYEAKNIKETGTIDISVFSRAGGGDATVITNCDLIQKHFFDLDMGDIEIIDYVPASEISAGDSAGKYYGCVISLTYNHYY